MTHRLIQPRSPQFAAILSIPRTFMQLDVEAAMAAWLCKIHDNTTPHQTNDDESIAIAMNRNRRCAVT